MTPQNFYAALFAGLRNILLQVNISQQHFLTRIGNTSESKTKQHFLTRLRSISKQDSETLLSQSWRHCWAKLRRLCKKDSTTFLSKTQQHFLVTVYYFLKPWTCLQPRIIYLRSRSFRITQKIEKERKYTFTTLLLTVRVCVAKF